MVLRQTTKHTDQQTPYQNEWCHIKSCTSFKGYQVKVFCFNSFSSSVNPSPSEQLIWTLISPTTCLLGDSFAICSSSNSKQKNDNDNHNIIIITEININKLGITKENQNTSNNLNQQGVNLSNQTRNWKPLHQNTMFKDSPLCVVLKLEWKPLHPSTPPPTSAKFLGSLWANHEAWNIKI